MRGWGSLILVSKWVLGIFFINRIGKEKGKGKWKYCKETDRKVRKYTHKCMIGGCKLKDEETILTQNVKEICEKLGSKFMLMWDG